MWSYWVQYYINDYSEKWHFLHFLKWLCYSMKLSDLVLNWKYRICMKNSNNVNFPTSLSFYKKAHGHFDHDITEGTFKVGFWSEFTSTIVFVTRSKTHAALKFAKTPAGYASRVCFGRLVWLQYWIFQNVVIWMHCLW